MMATWLEEAYYRNIDIFGACISNAHVIAGSQSCSHTATYSYTNYSSGTTKQNMSEKPDDYKYSGAGDGIAYKVDLFDSRTSMNAVHGSATCSQKYENERISISFKCNVDNNNIKTVNIASFYCHSKTNVSFSPTISVGSGGSVGISINAQKYYEKIIMKKKLAIIF